jgi:hypothetical protein
MDFYMGSGTGQWSFDNAAFTAEMEGGTITIAGSPVAELNGAFEIELVDSPTLVTLSDPPAIVDVTAVQATSISLTYTPDVEVTAGPQIVGVGLIPIAKEGANKLPSTKRAT